jgi:2,3-bisphosphoglycerate-dependent phosphoglycerate mutase
MKTLKLFGFIIVLVTFGCSSDEDTKNITIPQSQEAKTVIYLIRHAEKADASANPNLSEAGLQRAQNWAVILQDVAFDAFYSTDYNRTRQTIQPTADNNGHDLILYNPDTFSLESVINDHLGKSIMIVGHSNTIPQLINQFLGEDIYPVMAETEFGNLYKITIQGETVTHELTVHN